MAVAPLRRRYQPPIVEPPLGPDGLLNQAWIAHFDSLSKFINDDNSLQKDGGTMTGALILAAAPTLALGAATKAYVDAVSLALTALTTRVTAAEAAITALQTAATALAARVTTIEGQDAALAAGPSYANDAAAAAGGVLVGKPYRNGSVRQVRVV